MLEERVNETIIHRLSELENHFDRIDGKVDQISENVKENRAIIQQRDAKLNEILHEIKNLKKN